MYPDSIKKIIDSFRNLPGIGYKTAERLAFCMIDFDKDKLSEFSEAICNLRDNICNCSVCGNISDNSICSICANLDRDDSILLVVEKPKDIVLFEKFKWIDFSVRWNWSGRD